MLSYGERSYHVRGMCRSQLLHRVCSVMLSLHPQIAQQRGAIRSISLLKKLIIRYLVCFVNAHTNDSHIETSAHSEFDEFHCSFIFVASFYGRIFSVL